LDRYAVGHVFRGDAEEGRDALRAELFHADEANTYDGVAVLLVDDEWSGEKALDDVGVGTEIEEHASGDNALDGGKHVFGFYDGASRLSEVFAEEGADCH